MRPPVYSRFRQERLILRDELAIDRTLLANERTLLAYLRSGVALLIAGGTMIHFSQQGWFYFAGIVCIPSGILCISIGVARYFRMNRVIAQIRNRLPGRFREDHEYDSQEAHERPETER